MLYHVNELLESPFAFVVKNVEFMQDLIQCLYFHRDRSLLLLKYKYIALHMGICPTCLDFQPRWLIRRNHFHIGMALALPSTSLPVRATIREIQLPSVISKCHAYYVSSRCWTCSPCWAEVSRTSWCHCSACQHCPILARPCSLLTLVSARLPAGWLGSRQSRSPRQPTCEPRLQTLPVPTAVRDLSMPNTH